MIVKGESVIVTKMNLSTNINEHLCNFDDKSHKFATPVRPYWFTVRSDYAPCVIDNFKNRLFNGCISRFAGTM